jgi:anion-transporting  ArsA/GET3 family ATPase
MQTYASIAELVASKSILITCGSGGVGKTSISAALAMAAARDSGRKVLVMTIDPARRLADVIGLTNSVDTPVRLEVEGHLEALSLDAKKAWDELVHAHASDSATAERILNNPLYERITGSFVQSHDYIAMEKLYALHSANAWDLIIVDTPPVSQAVDFLDAPARMASFFDSRLLKFLVAPNRSSLLNITSRAFMQMANKLLGRQFLNDISELFTMLETMRPGFIERANRAQELLAADATSFMAVTSPEPAPIRSANGLIDELARRRLHLGAVVVNRVLPPALVGPEVEVAIEELGSSGIAGISPEELRRVAAAMSNNHARFAQLADLERSQIASLATTDAVVATAPLFDSDLANLDGLARLGESIWR